MKAEQAAAYHHFQRKAFSGLGWFLVAGIGFSGIIVLSHFGSLGASFWDVFGLSCWALIGFLNLRKFIVSSMDAHNIKHHFKGGETEETDGETKPPTAD